MKLNGQTGAAPEYNNPQLSKTALYKHDITLDTNNDLKNTTKVAISKLVKPFRPNVTVLGQGLIDEKNSQSWGGMFYRVLGNQDTYKNSTDVVVQYIYTWIRQKLPITFWNCVLPLIALLCISIFINTDTQIYSGNLESIEGVPSEIATILTTEIYNLSSILVVLFLLGIWIWELYKVLLLEDKTWKKQRMTYLFEERYIHPKFSLYIFKVKGFLTWDSFWGNHDFKIIGV